MVKRIFGVVVLIMGGFFIANIITNIVIFGSLDSLTFFIWLGLGIACIYSGLNQCRGHSANRKKIKSVLEMANHGEK